MLVKFRYKNGSVRKIQEYRARRLERLRFGVIETDKPAKKKAPKKNPEPPEMVEKAAPQPKPATKTAADDLLAKMRSPETQSLRPKAKRKDEPTPETKE